MTYRIAYLLEPVPHACYARCPSVRRASFSECLIGGVRIGSGVGCMSGSCSSSPGLKEFQCVLLSVSLMCQMIRWGWQTSYVRLKQTPVKF